MPLTRRSLLWIGALLAHPTAAQEHVAGASYTAFDDASWAVWNVKLSTMLGDKQSLYDHHIEQCKEAAGDSADRNCYVDEYHRMQMNMFQPRSVYNYTAQGFAKIRAPEKLYAVLRAFWEANREKGEIEWDNGKISPFHNHWDAPPTMIKVQEQIYPGGGSDLAAFVSDQSREILEQWTGQALAGSSVYGVRVYHNDSILTPHVDRLPLIISAIINVDQDVDEPWPLEVYDHDGVAHNITMEPGEMILYESHSVIHGRPFPMRGRYFANVFVHFETIGNATGDVLPKSGGLPPYLVKGSSWEPEYWQDFPDGWTTLSEIEQMVNIGDLKTFKYIVERHPQKARTIFDYQSGWQPIHEACRFRHLRIVKFLVEEAGVDINEPFYVPFPVTPLDVAFRYVQDRSHPIFTYLFEHGAVRGVELSKLADSAAQTVVLEA